MRLEDVIRVLETKRTDIAKQAIEAQPGGAADYDKGIYAGLRLAQQAIEQMHEDTEERRARM